MTKTSINGSVNFHATVKTYHQPVIIDQFVDDEGEIQFILANGNTIPANRYNSLWLPNKGTINWKAKGQNPDRTRNYLK